MKKILLTISILFIAANAHAGVITFGINAGNWSDNTKWVGGVKPANGDDVLFIDTSAACAVNEDTTLLKSLNMTGYLSALSGTFKISIRGLTASTNVCKIVGIGTWTGTLAFSPVSTTAVIQLTSNANLLTTMTVTSGAATSLVVLQDNLAFTATKNCSLTLTTQALDLNGFTLKGNSATNRLLIQSSTLGTARVITNVIATSLNNIDLKDITCTSAGNLDLTNSGANSIGDCGGNSASGGTLTMTTAANPTTVTGNSANWSTATWDVRVPLPQDRVVISLTAGQTLTVDMPRIGGGTGTGITFDTATKLTLGNVVTSYGSLDFTGSGTLAGAFNWGFESQARSGTNTITSSGKQFINNIYLNSVGTIIQTADAFTVSNAVININNGTFNTGSFSVTAGQMNGGTASATRGITSSGTWTILNNGFSWLPGSGMTMNLTNSTLILSDVSLTNKTFGNGGSYTYGNLQLTGGGSGAVIIQNSNTFNVVTVNAPKTIQFTAGTTQTISKFIANGQPSKRITITSATAAKHTLKLKQPTFVSHCDISWSDAQPYSMDLWNAHTHDGNIDRGGNRGWVFNMGEVWTRLKQAVTTSTGNFFLVW